jgi:FkbM family methyltransferase
MMSIRSFRRRITPRWLSTDARRRWRDRLYRRLGVQRCYAPPLVTRRPELLVRSLLPFVVAQELVHHGPITILQIGAFDGEGDDDLRDLVNAHGLRGVLVEPQPEAFARLQQTYRDQPQVTLLQAAIAERQGVRDLYCRRGAASMAASFDRGHLLRHGIKTDEIVVKRVVCHTVASALRTASLDRVDLIQIDAEGYDWPIIRSIDFTVLQPTILRFEYRNLPNRDADACLELLALHGYRFLLEPRDIIAVHSAGIGWEARTQALSRLSA